MALCQLFIQPEAAYTSVSELGESGTVQFRDVSKYDINMKLYFWGVHLFAHKFFECEKCVYSSVVFLSFHFHHILMFTSSAIVKSRCELISTEIRERSSSLR